MKRGNLQRVKGLDKILIDGKISSGKEG